MKQIPQLQKIIIPIVAVVIGLVIGLGIGQLQMKKEQKISQDRMKEASKKIAFIQKKMEEENSEEENSEKETVENMIGKRKKRSL